MPEPVKPVAVVEENSNPPENPTQETGTQETGSEPTPTVSANGSSSDTRLALMESLMRQQHRTISDLQAKLDRESAERDRVAQEQQRNAPENSSDFFQRPASNIREIIREETLRAVEPLYEFKKQLETESKYDKVKAQFKNDPRFREIFPKIEGLVDQLMSGSEVNEGNMQLAVLSAVGTYSLGMMPGQNGTPAMPVSNSTGNAPTPNLQGNQRVNTPPHIRPTAPLNTDSAAPKPARQLNELEARLARERGQSPEEYLAWLDEDPTKVAYSSIGKPPAKETK